MLSTQKGPSSPFATPGAVRGCQRGVLGLFLLPEAGPPGKQRPFCAGLGSSPSAPPCCSAEAPWGLPPFLLLSVNVLKLNISAGARAGQRCLYWFPLASPLFEHQQVSQPSASSCCPFLPHPAAIKASSQLNSPQNADDSRKQVPESLLVQPSKQRGKPAAHQHPARGSHLPEEPKSEGTKEPKSPLSQNIPGVWPARC